MIPIGRGQRELIIGDRQTGKTAMHADRTGLFNCPHTGVALAAMKKLVKRGEIRRDDKVVVISTAHGLKFTDYKLRYHEMRLEGIVPEVPNPPIELPADYATVRERMLREIDARFPL
jgi:threonine synthase